MIRNLKDNDLDEIMEIWLCSNTEAHSFVPESYWKNNFPGVKEALPKAEVYVYEDENGEIQGFIGFDGSYVAGLFVRKEARSKGVGKSLLDFAKDRKESLSLKVYAKNVRAVKFYEREGFKTTAEKIDGATGEREYLMAWEKGGEN